MLFLCLKGKLRPITNLLLKLPKQHPLIVKNIIVMQQLVGLPQSQLCAKVTNLRLVKGFSTPNSVCIWILTSENQGYIIHTYNTISWTSDQWLLLVKIDNSADLIKLYKDKFKLTNIVYQWCQKIKKTNIFKSAC